MHIGSPLGAECSDENGKGEATDDDAKSSKGDGGNVGNVDATNLMAKMNEVIMSMNQQMMLLTKRLEQLDQERAKKDDPDKLANINQKDISKPTKYNGNGWVVWSKNLMGFLESTEKPLMIQ